ncbi:MAG: PEP-CTERM sorting domain-containing protein [Phycisphaerales bacterium]|nr:PEP-CTERM sorting domain-containing protein [Phycisphaerales bacterium]
MTQQRPWLGLAAIGGVAGPTAIGAILYKDVPDIVLGLHNGPTSATIDVNHDGVHDFIVSVDTITPTNGYVIADGEGDIFELQRLDFGTPIQEIMPSAPSGLVGWHDYGIFKPSWPDDGGYLGFRISIDGEWRHGWMFAAYGPFEGDPAVLRIFDFAYETAPNRPILAGAVPAPGTLGALALGAAAFVRREKRSA